MKSNQKKIIEISNQGRVNNVDGCLAFSPCEESERVQPDPSETDYETLAQYL